MYHDSMLFFDV